MQFNDIKEKEEIRFFYYSSERNQITKICIKE